MVAAQVSPRPSSRRVVGFRVWCLVCQMQRSAWACSVSRAGTGTRSCPSARRLVVGVEQGE